MSRIISTSIIIYDSFNNVLVVQKGKKNSHEIWSLVGRDLKGKETLEKCITKAVDNDLACTIFDLNPFGEYVIDEKSGESLMVYSGIIRQHVITHKTINKVKWISKKDLDNHNFSANGKEILKDFFSAK